MNDKTEKIGKSLIQHGTYNNRVYVMDLHYKDVKDVILYINTLCDENKYTKVVVKAPRQSCADFIYAGYSIEAEVPGYYNGAEDCILLSKYSDEERKHTDNKEEIKQILAETKLRKPEIEQPEIEAGYSVQTLTEDNLSDLAELYSLIFASYPFPITDKNYLKETMDNNVEYAGIFYKGSLIAAASAEKAPEYQCAEMTDFATNPDHRGKNLSLYLLQYLEDSVAEQNYIILYTIARSLSYGMNITFKKAGYVYSGTLTNNTNISGTIQSMNVWFKNIKLSKQKKNLFKEIESAAVSAE